MDEGPLSLKSSGVVDMSTSSGKAFDEEEATPNS